MDARSQRSREALRAAVLDLAQSAPLSALTVTAVCERAEVTRDTFYRHAETVPALLADALGAELERVTGELLDRVPIREVERVLLAHVRDRRAVYRNAIDDALAGPVRSRLESVLRERLLDHARRHPSIVPAALASERALGFAAAYAAAGTVGAIEQWIRGGDDDVDAAAEIILAASPAWWLRAGDEREEGS